MPHLFQERCSWNSREDAVLVEKMIHQGEYLSLGSRRKRSLECNGMPVSMLAVDDNFSSIFNSKTSEEECWSNVLKKKHK